MKTMNGILKNRSLCAFCLMLLTLVFCSCKSRSGSSVVPSEPEPVETSVVINTLWGGNVPAGVGNLSFYFYPAGGGAAIVQTGVSSSGFSGILSPGKYKVLAWNAGASNVEAVGMESYETAAVAAKSLPAARSGQSAGLGEPAAVYAFRGEIEAKEGMSSTFSLTADPLTQTVSMQVRNSTGLDLKSVGCSFPGIILGRYLSRTKAEKPYKDEDMGTQPVSGAFKDDVAELTFRTFGVFNPASNPELADSPLLLTLEPGDGQEPLKTEIAGFGKLLGDILGEDDFLTGVKLDVALELKDDGKGDIAITVGGQEWKEHDKEIVIE